MICFEFLCCKEINVIVYYLKEVDMPFLVFDEYLATPNNYPTLI